MSYADIPRTFILSSSTAICDGATFLSYILEQITSNYRFVIFVAFVLLIVVFITVSVYIRKRTHGSVALNYMLGIMLFFIALNLKILISFFGGQAKKLDEKLFNALKGFTKNSRLSFLSAVMTPIIGLIANNNEIPNNSEQKIMLFSNENLAIPKNQFDLNSSFAISNIENDFLIDTNDSKGGSILDDKPISERIDRVEMDKSKKSKLQKPILQAQLLGNENSKKTADDTGKLKETVTKRGEENNIGISSVGKETQASIESKKPKSRSQVENKKTDENHDIKMNSDKKIEKEDKSKTKLSSETIKSDSSAKNIESTFAATKKQNDLTDFSPTANNQPTKERNVMLKYKIPLENVNNAILDDYDDQFFRNVLSVLDLEFTSNKVISTRIKELIKIIDITEDEILKLDSDIKKLIGMGTAIEKEMKSFNVSIDKYDPMRIDLIENLKKIFSLRALNENLNFRNGSDKNLQNIFKTDEQVKESTKPESANLLLLHNSFIQWFLVAQFVLIIIFFYFSLVGSNIYPFRLITCGFICINVLIGIFLMVGANFYDKDCILGKVPGCEASFGKNFTQFARSANIDLKPETTKIDSLRNLFDKMKSKSDTITATLSVFFEEDYVSEFSKHSIIFKNLINKIKFVQDDFKELTHSKIDQKQFYSILDSVNSRLIQISVNMKYIDKKLLLEFYTREAIFSNFIYKERENIIHSVEKQLEGTQRKKGKQKKIECGKILGSICEQRNALDNTSLLMVFGSLIFGIGLIF